MYSKIDLFFIILFIIVISIIIGLNIVNVIDKKISNVSVNIPPINPNITIKMCDGKVSTNVEGSDKHEHFIVSDAQELPRYSYLRNRIANEKNNFEKDTLEDPKTADDAVDYDDTDKDEFNVMVINADQHQVDPVKVYDKVDRPYITPVDYGWESPRQFISCANASIADKFRFGPKSLRPNQISCGGPNKLTAENYYKSHFKPHVLSMEDTHVRGYNYNEYSDFPTPVQVRSMRILSQNTKGLPQIETRTRNLPIGSNYAFHNTPAMPMP